MEDAAQPPQGDKDVLIVSIALTLFLFAIVSVSTLLLLCRVPVTWLNVVISLALTLVFVAKYANKKIASVIATASLLVASVAVVWFYYDDSWDGNAYHKLSAGLIESGWNPVYQKFSDYANATGNFLPRDWDIAGFYDGYPKASYIIGANFYALTGAIESGKAFTLIAMIGSAGIIAFFCKEMGSIRWSQSILVALTVCVNPITLTQLVTFMNDGILTLLIFQTTFALIYIAIDSRGFYDRYAYMVVFFSIALGLNFKFSALFPFTMICLAFLLFVTISRRREHRSHLTTKLSTVKVAALFGFAFLFGTAVLGSTSYVHNIFVHQNPVYPMAGPKGAAIIEVALPPAYKGLAPIQQFGYSLFSAVANDPGLASVELKIPFSFTAKEAQTAVFGGNARVGGWGIWFSGLLCLSLIAYGFVARKTPARLRFAFLTILIGATVPAFFIPAVNNARFWPLPLMIPPFVLLILFATDSLRGAKTMVAVVLLGANLALPAGGLILRTKQSSETRAQLNALANRDHDGQKLPLSLGAPGATLGGTVFDGLFYNLHDAGVRNGVQFWPSELVKQPGQIMEVDFSVSKNSPVRIQYVLQPK